jgi:SulP family sulfate permease
MFIPEIFSALKGYTRGQFVSDVLAGITVGVVAIPLAIAFGINSGPGLTPAHGMYTAVVAGFLISFLGGSRVQIGGPTGAFVPILYMITAKYGYDGLCQCGLMAGVILMVMAFAKAGNMIKFIPYPVTTGFTAGIAVIIASSQVNDFLGLGIKPLPAEFREKLIEYSGAILGGAIDWPTTAVALGSLLIIVFWPKLTSRVPGSIVALLAATTAVQLLGLKVETIGARFAGFEDAIPVSPPAFRMPELDFSPARLRELMAPTVTLALLAGIESLLSAVVADGMIGSRHQSNTELFAQGVANVVSPLFGGIPATGAIARTATNVKSGGRTPVAGMVHALTLLAVILLFGRFARMIPMASLAAVLMVVAWNMSERHAFRSLLRAPRSDIIVLLTTFLLTVVIDLVVAVEVGMVAAAILFIKRMADVTNVEAITGSGHDLDKKIPDRIDVKDVLSRKIPKGVEVYEIYGPFFFAAADKLRSALDSIAERPKVFILRMSHVLAIDATGMHALEQFVHESNKNGTRVILSAIHSQPLFALAQAGKLDALGEDNLAGDIDDALAKARRHLGLPEEAPAGSAGPAAADTALRDRVSV